MKIRKPRALRYKFWIDPEQRTALPNTGNPGRRAVN
jgi:hypothetical protein